MEEEGDTADMEPGREQMEMESSVQLICQVTDGLHAGRGGRQGQSWQPETAATLPFFSLICLRRPLYSPCRAVLSCTEVVVLVGGWGPQGSRVPPLHLQDTPDTRNQTHFK